MTKFRNLIFDIGNVLVDIDYTVPIAEFQKLVPPNTDFRFETVVSYTNQHNIFDLFEKGKVTVPQFRDGLKQLLKPDVTDAEIDLAWNSILINYPLAKFELLKQLKTRYYTLALSNINELHVQAIDIAAAQLLNEDRFGNFFHKAYYSNEMGWRKPEKEIYEMLIQQENLNRAETFFVDDKLENIEMAREVGLQAYQLTERDKLDELLRELNII